MIETRNLGANIFSEDSGAFDGGWNRVSEQDKENYSQSYTYRGRAYEVLEIKEHYQSFSSFIRLRNLALAILITLVSLGVALCHPVVKQWFTGRQVAVIVRIDPDLQIARPIDWESVPGEHNLARFARATFRCDILLFCSDQSDGVRPYYLIRGHARLNELREVLTHGCADFEVLTIDDGMVREMQIAPSYRNGIAIFVQEHDQNDVEHTLSVDGQPISPGLNMGKAFRWLAEILPQQLGYRIVWEQDVKERFKNSLVERREPFSRDNTMGFLKQDNFKEFFPALKGSYYVLDNLPS